MAQTADDKSPERLPTKRMAAGALFFNHREEVLIVKPTYRDDWLIPGGVVELDESPYHACIREVREEIGISPPIQQLLCIEYQSAHSSESKSESVQFIFSGGVLNDIKIKQIRLASDEIAEALWCSEEQAKQLLAPKLAERLEWAQVGLREDRIVYIENKKETGSMIENNRRSTSRCSGRADTRR